MVLKIAVVIVLVINIEWCWCNIVREKRVWCIMYKIFHHHSSFILLLSSSSHIYNYYFLKKYVELQCYFYAIHNLYFRPTLII